MKKQNGFSLMEMMVVLVIMGILLSLVAPRLLNQKGEAQVTAAKNDINSMSTAIDVYSMNNNGAIPSTAQGLKALVSKPSGEPVANNWRGPYIQKLPTDPWGTPYAYIDNGTGDYEIISFGADKREGGEGDNKDISNKD